MTAIDQPCTSVDDGETGGADLGAADKVKCNSAALIDVGINVCCCSIVDC